MTNQPGTGEQQPRRSRASALRLWGGLAFVILLIIIGAVIAMQALGGRSVGPERAELRVELQVIAEGDFTVTYTEPPEIGSQTATFIEVEATDRFETSFVTDLNALQFHAGIVQSNIGPQEISCAIKIDGEIVLERTSDRRFVDCSADLQEL